MSVFTWPMRVYWEDTDGGGIVYYANYLRFLERARTEWLRRLGHSQRELAERAGIAFIVVKLAVQYRRPARLDDELAVSCNPLRAGRASLSFAQSIHRLGDPASSSERLLVRASVQVACVDAASLRPKRLPEFLCAAVPQTAAPQRTTLQETMLNE